MFGRPEQGLESLYSWMDIEQHRVADQRGGWLGAILGTTWGLTGGAIGVLMGAFKVSPNWLPLILAPAAFATVGALIWYFRARTDEERSFAKIRGEARGVLQRLATARWTGRLRDTLGEDAAQLLNDAAREWARCRTALDSPVLKATTPESPWGRARESGLRSIETAMARMVLFVGNGAVSSRESGPGPALLQEMKRLADEAAKMAERLAARHGGSSGDASGDLRRTIQEFQMLSSAEDELELDSLEERK